MMSTQEAYDRGFASGRRGASTLRQRIDSTLAAWEVGHPSGAHLDYAKQLIELDQLRIDSPPSVTTFPETRGWPDIIRAQRRGFREGSGADDLGVAFRFCSHYFMSTRLNTRYVGSPIGTNNCTAVFIRDTAEGGPLYGRNWDETNRPGKDLQPPRHGPDGKRRLWCKGVSCATLCDEEPTEIFPIDAWLVLPDDCRRLDDVVQFLTRYVEFWMPHNGIIVDENLDSIAYEKTNCRVAWRKSDDGTAAVTACAQLDPQMKAFRETCHRRSLAQRGLDETSADWLYWSGAESRYHRLLALVKKAAANSPTLDDLAAIMTDHAAPYPQRICIAGQTCHPDLKNVNTEWTMRSRSVVLEGPNARTHFWRVEGDQACYDNPPFLIPGDGVKVQPQWLKNTRPLPATDGPDDDMERYRRYEFDYPREYPE